MITTFYWIFVSIFLLAVAVAVYGLYRWLGIKFILYAFMQSGTGRAVVNGDGEVQDFMISLHGFDINNPNKPHQYIKDNPDWEILPVQTFIDADIGYKPRSGLMKRLGIYWIRDWPVSKIYSYTFSWAEFDQPKGKTEYEVISRKERTNIFMVKDFPYFSEVKTIFINGNMKFSFHFSVNLAITNPFKALFGNDDWLATALFALNEAAKNWVGQQRLEDLVSDTDNVGTVDEFHKFMLKAMTGFLKEKVGCELKSANFLRLIDENKDATDYLQAIHAVALAQREAEASVHVAKKITNIGKAEAKVIGKKAVAAVAGEGAYVAAYSGHPELAHARALEQTHLNTYVASGTKTGVILPPSSPKDEKKDTGSSAPPAS